MYMLLSTNTYHEDWIFPYLKPYIKPDHKVVVFPFSFRDEWIANEMDWDNCYLAPSGKYYMECVGSFEAYGLNLSQVTFLNYFKDTAQHMSKVIANADILFFTGGLPEKAVARIESLGLTESIQLHQGLKIGVSAGALMHFPNYFVSPDDDYPELLYFEGLGTIDTPRFIEVHFDKENKAQLAAIEDAIGHHCNSVYAIGDQGAIFIRNGEWELIGDVQCFER